MQAQGQHGNIQEPKLGHINDNQVVEHLWNISRALVEAEQHCQIWSKTARHRESRRQM